MTFSEAGRTYRLYLICVVLLLAGLYWKIVPEMVLDWYHDENYSHGFLVPIIAGYFIYTRWDDLKDAPVTPWRAGLAVILVGLCQLLIGWLGVEYFTMRSSLIVLLAGLVLYFFGIAVFRIVTLPIVYLFLMVPIPYIVYDAVAFPLKLFVTKISVATLKISGVVVLREGNIIMFPTTTLEVANACSGIRSLISLLALAVAYAFFLRITPLKRFILICAAVPIAIFTNALRVIVTGFLAQHWGAKAAEGFFHEFAGLAVFAVAMAMLVSLGILLGRGEQQISANQNKMTGLSQDSKVISLRSETAKYIIVYLLLISSALFMNLHNDITVPMNKPFDQFPAVVSGWQMTGKFTFSDSVQDVLKASDLLARQYISSEGKKVNLYIGYHGGGKEIGEIHSPKHCLPGSGWHEVSTKRDHYEVNGERINIVRAVYQKGENKELFIYWFHVKGKTLSDEYSLKLAEITNSILYRRRDAAFIRVSVPFEADERGATAIGERFVKDFFPVIREFLPG